ncbi:acyl-CoA dehydrogenase [Pseudomonas gingeri]|uniref:acyl-CoA dehydrogenase n=1 Tax=Pseudomonas gingeri TaxID=117681 RepID=UPI0015A48756|nr:acyl-CoA dehydrogenase [Pseudomonas gingeri]NWD66922.1 acyl-CoA dehydrogenase [Pseudomonas gingeri]
MTVNIGHLRKWIGQQRTLTDDMSPFSAKAMAALFDDSMALEAGDRLPASWHWLYFKEHANTSGVGADGHPLRGDFLPPITLERRMWAAGELSVERPLLLGIEATKQSTIESVELKEGRSGPLVFVSLRHRILQNGECCINELQHLVYRDLPSKGGQTLPPGVMLSVKPDWEGIISTDPVLLFRFSALTYNAHRIHYDRDYARNQEFYPDLVVHGPLLAMWLLYFLKQKNPSASVVSFEFRALRPNFCDKAITLCAKREANRIHLWSTDESGAVCVQATARVKENPYEQ